MYNRNRTLALIVAWVAMALVPTAVFAQATGRWTPKSGKFFFKDGDRIVVMGDSITEQHLYSNYLEMWTVTRFPAWNLTFRNVGIGGDRSVGGNSRFKRDVLAHKATALTVDFGMNDGGYQKFNPTLYDAYMKGLQGIADQAKQAGIRVAFITPQPIERREPGKQLEAYNRTLEKFSAGVQEMADRNGGVFVDQFHPYLAVMDKARQTDPKIIVTGGDAVHPGPPGQSLMAASILSGLSFPATVSDVNITLKRRKLVYNVNNCTVTKLTTTPEGGISFERQDQALPYFPSEAKSILKWAPTLLTDMNQYKLRVSGLRAGSYEVRLGGRKIANHSAEELARGVNLAEAALASGPIADQVKDVWQKVVDKNRYFHDRIFRGVLLASGKSFKIQADRDAAYEERMQKMPELDAAVREALKMQPYTVEIVRVPDKGQG